MHPEKPAKSQKQSFTDEQIRTKAYQIWQKNRECSPEENWNAAIQALKTERRFQPLISIWRWTGISEKKGWDILQLAITASIPLGIFLGTQYFSTKNNEQQQRTNKDKASQDTLVKYLDEMTKILENGLLQIKTNSDNKFITAQAKTVVTLQSLDPMRQHLVIQFLDAAKLNTLAGNKGILYQARMSEANLNQADLSGANLKHADLSGANLSEAYLNEADLSEAYLSEANLSGANLSEVNLSGANLSEANLSGANLSKANLSGANLSEANLSGTNLSRANKLTRAQIRAACNWKEAIYIESADWDDQNRIRIVENKQAYQEKIKENKQDKASDLTKPSSSACFK